MRSILIALVLVQACAFASATFFNPFGSVPSNAEQRINTPKFRPQRFDEPIVAAPKIESAPVAKPQVVAVESIQSAPVASAPAATIESAPTPSANAIFQAQVSAPAVVTAGSNTLESAIDPSTVLKGAEAAANFHLAATGAWGYDSNNNKAPPSAWKSIAVACGEGAATEKQSPVNLVKTVYDENLDKTPLIFREYDPVGSLMVSNDGHTIAVTYPAQNAKWRVTGGPLKRPYILFNIKFHWGFTSVEGSEHKIKGASYPLEMQLYHYDSQFDTPDEAANYPDGIAVVSVMVSVGYTNTELAKIQALLPTIYNGTTTAQMPATPTFDLIRTLPARRMSSTTHQTDDFYTYSGSLTTPNCNEVVIWIVLKDNMWISEAQMQAFRAIRDDYNVRIIFNNRPIQPANGRVLSRSFKDPAEDSAGFMAAPSVALVTAGIALVMSLAGRV